MTREARYTEYLLGSVHGETGAELHLLDEDPLERENRGPDPALRALRGELHQRRRDHEWRRADRATPGTLVAPV